MKTCFFLTALLFASFSFAQSDRYQIKLIPDGAYEQIKTSVKDYGSYQLVGGTYNDNGTTRFWFAKVAGGTGVWIKTVAAHPVWAPMDIAPTDIARCSANDDIIFVGRGNSGNDYTAKVIKVNASGDILWTREINTEPGTYSQTIYENNPMIMENDGVIISMAGDNHLQITKLDLNGNQVYSKQLQVDGTQSILNPGHLFIPNSSGGYFAGFECDNSPAIVSLDESLNVLWAKKITQGENAQLRSMVQTQAGDILLGGIGEGEGETFLARLNENGVEQNYASFTDSELYSIDQLFEMNDTTVIANVRTGYLLVNPNDWTYDEMLNDSPFCSFDKSPNGWSFGSHWNYDYYLDFDPRNPECISYTGPEAKNSTAISATEETITCTVANMGTLINYSPTPTSVLVALFNDCFLSVEDKTQTDLTIYPNPLRAGENLSFLSNELQGKNARVLFTDLQGKLMAEMIFEQEITTPALSSGVYFVRILGENGALVALKKIVIE
jgi:hypothetical protein